MRSARIPDLGPKEPGPRSGSSHFPLQRELEAGGGKKTARAKPREAGRAARQRRAGGEGAAGPGKTNMAATQAAIAAVLAPDGLPRFEECVQGAGGRAPPSSSPWRGVP